MSMVRSFALTASTLTVAAAFALGSLRPARANAQARQGPAAPNGDTVGGIACDAQEGQRIHIHQHVVIFDHGRQVAVPADVGRPADGHCIYWLHTHTPDGIIHIEAPVNRSFTLGDFFTVWGQPLTRTTAATAHAGKGAALEVWVDGKPFTGNPRAIPLRAHTDIVIEAGPPFPKPPRFTNWGPL